MTQPAVGHDHTKSDPPVNTDFCRAMFIDMAGKQSITAQPNAVLTVEFNSSQPFLSQPNPVKVQRLVHHKDNSHQFPSVPIVLFFNHSRLVVRPTLKGLKPRGWELLV